MTQQPYQTNKTTVCPLVAWLALKDLLQLLQQICHDYCSRTQCTGSLDVMIFHSGALLLVHFEVYDKSDLQSLMHQRLREDGKRRFGGSAFATGCVSNKSIKFCKGIQNAGNDICYATRFRFLCPLYFSIFFVSLSNTVEHKIPFQITSLIAKDF